MKSSQIWQLMYRSTRDLAIRGLGPCRQHQWAVCVQSGSHLSIHQLCVIRSGWQQIQVFSKVGRGRVNHEGIGNELPMPKALLGKECESRVKPSRLVGGGALPENFKIGVFSPCNLGTPPVYFEDRTFFT